MSLLDESPLLKEKILSILERDVDVVEGCPVKIEDMYFQLSDDRKQLAVFMLGGYSMKMWQPFDSKARLMELCSQYEPTRPPNACD